MDVGDTFLVPDAFGTHLNVVIAILDDGSVIHCHLTTFNRHSDTTCIIEAGEHSFVVHRTAVRYDQAQICCDGMQMEALERSIEKRFEPVNIELLRRIKEGALASPQTPGKVKDLLRRTK